MLEKMDLAVLIALAVGNEKTVDICDACGYSGYRVREKLRQLEAEGYARRVHYRAWALGDKGHKTVNKLWITYVKNSRERNEAHDMIVSTISEAHNMCVSDSQHKAEAHEMWPSSAQNVRFSAPYDHDDYDHDVDIETELLEIGFDNAGKWLESIEREKCELVTVWLDYVRLMNGKSPKSIHNAPGLIRRKVEKGESPPMAKQLKQRRELREAAMAVVVR